MNTVDSHLESNFSNLLSSRGSKSYLNSKRYHMVQSATDERALFGIKPFWERTREPPLRWERWRIFQKLAMLAKEGISVDTLREELPEKSVCPLNPSTK